MSSVTSILEAFQVINLSVAGIVSAPALASYPNTIEVAQLPCAITLPGPGFWPPSGGLGAGRKNPRSWEVRVYVAKTDANAAAAITTCCTLLEAFGAKYRATGSVDGKPIMLRSGELITDAGLLRTIPYGGEQYFGFAFSIPVQDQS